MSQSNLIATGIPPNVIDMHFHVGVRGDTIFKGLGHFSEDYMRDAAFDVFLFFARVPKSEVTDECLFRHTVDTLRCTGISKVVCLALDHYFDPKTGDPDPSKSKMWVSNEFIVGHLRPALPEKVLFGCSVNPNDRRHFQQRTMECVSQDAVLMKWLPSVQGIDLAAPWVGEAMKFMATAGRDGGPLPLLLHVGPEHAIPPAEPRMTTYDFLSWGPWDRLLNVFRRCHTPNIKGIRANLEAALDTGARIIFAHCGAPYFKFPWYKGPSEHSDFRVVAEFLHRSARGEFRGACFADVSAFVSPMRRPYFEDIKKLPPDLLLFGSDFPVPVVELSAGPEEWWDDLTHMIATGQLDRVIVPEDNLLDVNYRELQKAFPGHPLFTNAEGLLFGRIRGEPNVELHG